MTKRLALEWINAVCRGFAWSRTEEAEDFFREWLWILYCALYGEKRARAMWEMRES